MTQRNHKPTSLPAVQGSDAPESVPPEQQLLDQSPDVICSINAEGRFQFVSAAAKKTWGYDPSELLAVAYDNLVLPEDRQQTQQKMQALIKEDHSGYFRNRILRKDGSAVKMVWSARWNESLQTLYCVGMDATEQEESDRQALYYEQRLFRAYRLGRIGWWEWNAVKNTILVSDELYDIYGLDKKTYPVLTMEVYMSLVHPEDLQKVFAAISQNKVKAQHQYEHRMIKPSGKVIYVLHHVESVQDQQGTLLHMHGVTKDITDTKQAEMTLRQSEQRLTNILESIGDCFFALDKNWVVTYWNRKAEEMLQKKREDIIGKNIWSEYNDPITKAFYPRYLKAIAEHKPAHFEAYYPEVAMWVGISAYPSAEGLSVYFKNITQQKKSQEALHISNQRYELASKATSDIIWDMDLKTKTIYWGEGFRKLFGHTFIDEISDSQAWMRLIHPLDVDRIQNSLEKVINSAENNWADEYRFLRADGSYAYVLDKGFLIRDENGKAVRMVGAMQDITQQKEAETAIKLSEERFRLLFFQSPTPKWMFNAETLQIVEVNEAALRLFGYSKEEFLQLSLHDLILDDDRPELDTITEENLTRYKDIVLQQKKSGEIFSLEISSQPIDLPTGRHYIVIGDDVTEKIALQQMVLEEKFAAQKEVAKAIINTQENERSEIAKELHDNVNQLLTTAKLYIENIHYFPDQQEKFTQKCIALLQKSIDEIRSISKQLVTPVINDIGFKATLDELLNHYSSMNLFQVDLKYNLQEESLEKGLQLTIYRIIQEQMNNIVKYAKASAVQIEVIACRQKLEVTIGDNGIGFDKRKLTKGLGLKNMKNRAEVYKGDFRILSTAGNGTVVQVVFPFQPEAED